MCVCVCLCVFMRWCFQHLTLFPSFVVMHVGGNVAVVSESPHAQYLTDTSICRGRKDMGWEEEEEDEAVDAGAGAGAGVGEGEGEGVAADSAVISM